MGNSKVIIDRCCISYIIQELKRFVYVTIIFVFFLSLAIWLSLIKGHLLPLDSLIQKDLTLYGIWLLITYIPTFFKSRIFIHRVEIVSDFIKVSWQTRKEKKEILCHLQNTQSELTIGRSRGAFTYLTLTFKMENESIELKQFYFPMWDLSEMQIVDNAIKEAQSALLKENS